MYSIQWTFLGSSIEYKIHFMYAWNLQIWKCVSCFWCSLWRDNVILGYINYYIIICQLRCVDHHTLVRLFYFHSISICWAAHLEFFPLTWLQLGKTGLQLKTFSFFSFCQNTLTRTNHQIDPNSWMLSSKTKLSIIILQSINE